jgi:hypothetical protein
MRRKLLAALSLAGALSTPGLAAPIAVPNDTFDGPDIADGATLAIVTLDTTTIPGWTASLAGAGISQGGIRDPQDAQFAGTTGDNAALPGTADGGQTVFFRGSLAGNTEVFVTVDPLATVEAGETYTLTVAVGNALDSDPGDVAVQLTVNNSVVAQTMANAAGLPDGTFTDLQAVYVAPASGPQVGGVLKIRLRQLVTGAGNQFAYFDRIELEDGAVPEPAAPLLLATGAAALAGARRVRRRIPG